MSNLSVLKGKVLNNEVDEKLQQIVHNASKVSGFPIALVTLILRHSQFFKAHIGLPDDLAAVRSTDSCISFCQYVVRTKKPLIIQDTKKEPKLPQQLIQLYGIRAYYGYPLSVDNEVVGSLCVIDTKPNEIDPEKQTQIKVLALQASNRLTELAKMKTTWYEGNEQKPSSDREIWNNIAGARHDIKIAMTELLPAFTSMGDKSGSKRDEILKDTSKSFEDLKAAVLHLDTQLAKLRSK